MQATDILMQEHEVILRVIGALEIETDRLAAGQDVRPAFSWMRRTSSRALPMAATTRKKRACCSRRGERWSAQARRTDPGDAGRA